MTLRPETIKKRGAIKMKYANNLTEEYLLKAIDSLRVAKTETIDVDVNLCIQAGINELMLIRNKIANLRAAEQKAAEKTRGANQSLVKF